VSVYIVNNDAVSRRGGIVLKLKKKNAVRIRSLKKKKKEKERAFLHQKRVDSYKYVIFRSA